MDESSDGTLSRGVRPSQWVGNARMRIQRDRTRFVENLYQFQMGSKQLLRWAKSDKSDSWLVTGLCLPPKNPNEIIHGY